MRVESQIHREFKLQGESFESPQELINFSQHISSEVNSFLKEWFDTKSYVEVRTSGSTGKPKVIQLQKKRMVNSAIATGNYFNLPEDTTALLCMSPNYIAGKMMLVRALTLGWHLEVVEASVNPLKNNKRQYDFSAMVPLQLHNSLPDIHNVKKLIVGGGVVSKELFNAIQHVETEIFATYGMTETITHIAVKRLNQFRSAELVSAPHYKTLPNVTVSTDSRGCLVIEAPNVSEEKVVTNDVVELISLTKFKWLGRFDAVINSGGVKLIPEQIEDKLSKIISQRFFVSGIPDVILGEKLILVIESSNASSKNVILNSVKNLQSLSKFETPKEIYFVEKFVETGTKKINRNETLKIIKSTC